jgi:hypothetical protein
MPATSTPRSPQKLALAAFTGLSLLGIVTGCTSEVADANAPATSDATPTQASTPSSTAAASDPAAATAPGTDSSKYADGEYSEVGQYVSPGGQEQIKVDLTLKGDLVTAVTVTPQSTNPNGKFYEGKFAGGISAIVVGKNIDDLKVSKVAGSSLTSGGFKQAIDKIKDDAAG